MLLHVLRVQGLLELNRLWSHSLSDLYSVSSFGKIINLLVPKTKIT